MGLNSIIDCEDLDLASELLNKNILKAASTTIPSNLDTIRSNDVPRFQVHIHKVIRCRLKLYKRAKILKTYETWSIFKKKHNEVKKDIREATTLLPSKIVE